MTILTILVHFFIFKRLVSNKVLIYLAPSVLLLVFDLVFYYIFIDISDVLILFLMSFTVANLFLAGFLVAHAVSKTRLDPRRSYHDREAKHDSYSGTLAITIFFLLGALVINHMVSASGMSALQLLSSPASFARFYGVSHREGSAIFQYVLFILTFAIIYVYSYTKRIQHAFGVIAFLLMLSMLGGRSLLICVVFMVLYISSERYRIKAGLLFGGMALILGIILIGTSLRVPDLDFYLEKVVRFDFDLSDVFSDSLRYVHQHGPSWFLFLRDFQSFIPSAFWPDKPISTAETHLLYSERALSGTSTTFGLYGNAVINFGILGILPVCVAYFGFGFYYYRYCKRELPAGWMYFFHSALAFQTNWLRGGLFSVRLVELLVVMLVGFTLGKTVMRVMNRKIVAQLALLKQDFTA